MQYIIILFQDTPTLKSYVFGTIIWINEFIVSYMRQQFSENVLLLLLLLLKPGKAVFLLLFLLLLCNAFQSLLYKNDTIPKLPSNPTLERDTFNTAYFPKASTTVKWYCCNFLSSVKL